LKLGLIPGYGGTQRLARATGSGRALELMLGGAELSAEEALRVGLVSHLVEPEQLETKLQEILSRLRELSAPALEATRRALDTGRGWSFDETLKRVENLYLNELMKTEDAAEGVRAFMEKRKPVWRNR
jgi:enoyl-CoA hydratase/carnithine racemase